jgi:hypothetical protein
MPTVTVGLAASLSAGFAAVSTDMARKRPRAWSRHHPSVASWGNILFNRRVCIMVAGASHHTAWSNLLGYLVE